MSAQIGMLFESGKAKREMVTLDSEFSFEEYETLCKNHNRGEDNEQDIK